jgi:tRNA(fMet)-specific endonuclease VapC
MADRALGILLDSSVIIAHFRRKLDLFQLVRPIEPLFMPLIVLGELYKGAYKSADRQKNLNLIESFLKVVAVLHPDEETAACYGQIAANLESQGQNIPENDIWIAALAVALDMPLATRDAHFQRVDGLQVLNW